MKEFKVNDFLTLKLEENTTNIYVKGELFEQCKFLLVNIPTKFTKENDEIDSMDEIANLLRWTEDGQKGIKSLLNDPDILKIRRGDNWIAITDLLSWTEYGQQRPKNLLDDPEVLKYKEGDNYIIGPETEFWGHCSNLQVWSENDYDTRLLHTYLSFPLLKKLTQVGDPIAKKVFKKEILLRLKSGYPSVVDYILEEDLLYNFNQEELEKLMEQNWHRSLDLTQLKKLSEVIGPLAKNAYNEKWAWQKKRTTLLGMASLKNKENRERLITPQLAYISSELEKNIKNFREENPDEKFDYDKIFVVFSGLLEAVKEAGLIEDHFPTFLETVEKLHDDYQLRALDFLIKTVKETGLIEDYFLAILEVIDKLRYKFRAFTHLLEVAKETDLIKKHLGALLEIFPLLPDISSLLKQEPINVYSKLIDVIKGTDLENERVFKEWEEPNLDLIRGYISRKKKRNSWC